MAFVPLHSHSQYSLLDATASVKGIAKRAAELGMTAAALTDHGNLYGAVEFYQACRDVNVKPLIGCELYVAPGSCREKVRLPGRRNAYHLILLARDREGYRNLCKLSSKGFLDGFYYTPRIDREMLQEACRGLVCLSACLSGEVAQAILNNQEEELYSTVRFYQDLFGEHYYLEIQRHTMSEEDIEADGMLEEEWLVQRYQQFARDQARVNERLLALSQELGIKLVATNDSHYLERSEWRAHEVLLNVQSGEPCEVWERDSLGNPKRRVPNPRRRTYPSHEMYFKSPEQMKVLFADVPSAIETTLEIADLCCLEFDFTTKHYPVYVSPKLEGGSYSAEERQRASEEFLQELCQSGMSKRYTTERLTKIRELFPDQDPIQIVRERLQREMDLILRSGMCDYLLIVWDFIDWAKRQGIPVGPGRGSGAGSIILYLIGVTDVEPIRFGLFFERFINPERVSYPDIDVDICMERRGEVIDYTVRKYGSDNVAQIITFGTMKAKMAIKDVGRVLSIPLPKVNQIAKLVPEEIGITLERALEVDPDLCRLYAEDRETKALIDLARQLEGCMRNTGIHAAGVIVSAEPLMEHIPLCTAKDSDMAVTQYSMKPVEMVGMLKIDFLGLKTLTCIQRAVESIERNASDRIDPLELPLDDAKTYDLLNGGQTLGVFQIETGGMQDLSRQLHLDRFEEIIAVGSLYRPGPMEMIPSFISRKFGREPIDYDHPLMKEILEETYGIMVYQEQVIRIAQVLALYTAGEGDVLRKAMGKKIHEEMQHQRNKFVSGCESNHISREIAERIFAKMEKFASYGFNKSHATCYALLTYVTAYLKANYPREWMAALMTLDRDDTAKIARFIREAHQMDIEILPPDINESTEAFVPTKKGIRFAMGAIKGVGQGVVEAIVKERQAGHFASLFEFIRRLYKHKVGKRVLECLVDAGCFDFTGRSRASLRLQVESMLQTVSKSETDREAGVMSLFSLLDGEEEQSRFVALPQLDVVDDRWSLLLKERELLGFFLSGHPLDHFKEQLLQLSCLSLASSATLEHQTLFRAGFIVEEVMTRIASKSQRKFAILTISDGFEAYELPVWPDLYEENGALLEENRLLYAVLQVDRSEGTPRLSCRWLGDLTRADEAMIRACDEAFDRAKLQSTRFRSRRKEVEMKEATRLQIVLDLSILRLSHLLEIKRLFRSNAGPVSVLLHFRSSEGSRGKVLIEEPWGVNGSQDLIEKIRALPCVSEVT